MSESTFVLCHFLPQGVFPVWFQLVLLKACCVFIVSAMVYTLHRHCVELLEEFFLLLKVVLFRLKVTFQGITAWCPDVLISERNDDHIVFAPQLPIISLFHFTRQTYKILRQIYYPLYIKILFLKKVKLSKITPRTRLCCTVIRRPLVALNVQQKKQKKNTDITVLCLSVESSCQ